ncbi:hypothetical protein [Gimesia fumaroli]|uniref:SigmaW regulon antibacterial n=1 Tax=Gimesia fumaroli TaxID=2527976 RepID=A0A518I6V8_9PLAN|nr:hypothetical protein [Gimesia fumaroli]QDV48831.1 SigmaW regulon antibacterial [Gimesia fumaroli]
MNQSFVLGFVAGVVMMICLSFLFRLLLPWRRALLCNSHVSILQIIAIRLRGHPPDLLIDALVKLRMNDKTEISIQQIERCYIKNRQANMDADTLVALVEQEVQGDK